VLRGAQFAARFDFKIADDTIEICRRIDLTTLSKERVEEELKKALLKAERPSIFFESLRAMAQLAVWFPEIEQLITTDAVPNIDTLNGKIKVVSVAPLFGEAIRRIHEGKSVSPLFDTAGF
jgi:tRNA nucleotidyltransferase (CCA-adding enzyme)